MSYNNALEVTRKRQFEVLTVGADSYFGLQGRRQARRRERVVQLETDGVRGGM